MWGDVRGATDLDTSSPLSTLLLQLTGPASISLSSPQWRSILLHYDKLVHLNPQDNVLVKTACHAMARHAVSSSNLAALTLHVVRMLTDLYGHVLKGGGEKKEEEEMVVLVGKVRATCGALNLLRILAHETIESCCNGATMAGETAENGDGEEGGEGRRISLGASSAIEEVFVYRDVTDGGESHRRDAASELLSILIPFLSLPHPPPALYDATIFSLSLLLILLSTQLYQPMISSAQLEEGYSQLSPSERDSIPGYHPFLTRLMKLPHINATTNHNNGNTNSHTSLVTTALQWFAKRPKPPPRSIAAHHCEMMTSLVRSKGYRPGLDGLYENHSIVTASRRRDSDETNVDDLDNGEEIDGDDHHHRSSSFIGSATQGVIDITSTIILLPFRLVRLAMSTIGLIGPYDISSRGMEVKKGGGVMDVMWMSDSPLADMGCCLLLLLAHNHHVKDKNGESEAKVTNPFREELALMKDVRWDDTDMPPPTAVPPSTTAVVAVNFESLFEAFGATLHNEMGALLLYTMLQSSPAFAASIAVRSDLDTLVMPLLRTVYFSSSVHYGGEGEKEGG